MVCEIRLTLQSRAERSELSYLGIELVELIKRMVPYRANASRPNFRMASMVSLTSSQVVP